MNKRLILMTTLGNIAIGLGIALLNLTGFGIDPFTSMTKGVSHLLGISLGVFQMILNIIMYVPILYLNRKAFGIGALINLFLLGFIVDYFGKFFALFHINEASLSPFIAIRIVLLVVAILVLCFGCALYMDCDMGVAPYDAIAPLIEAKTGFPFKYARIGTDVICAIIGLVTGMIGHVTTVGLATVFVALGMGPIIDWYQRHITHRLTGRS
ncbi:MAG: YitT family protein [Sharpea porci]